MARLDEMRPRANMAEYKAEIGSMKTKTLNLGLEIKNFKEDDEMFRFKGLLSTFNNRDRGGDIVQPGAFDETLARLKRDAREVPGMPGVKRILPILWQHSMHEPIGSFTSVEVVPEGLAVEGMMPKSDALVRDRVIPQMRVGSISDMSMGYIPLKTSRNTEGDRLLDVVELLEGSLVTIPMNPAAQVSEMKGVVPFKDLPLADRSREWDSEKAIERIRELTGSQDGPTSAYRAAFLWFDSDSADDFGAYKLPIADVIDGEMRAVPRAIFAAAAAMRGARGGVDIPEGDRPGIVGNLERYYDKLGLDSPFTEKGFRIDDLEALDERTLEKCLKGGAILPGTVARTIISVLKSSKRDAEEDEKRDADLKQVLESGFNSLNSLFNPNQ